MSWTNLEDKTIIVTGGAAGIGLAVTKGFVEVGAKVMIADFAEDVGKRAVEEANQAGSGEAAFAKCGRYFEDRGRCSRSNNDRPVGGGRCACKQCGN